MNEILRTVYPDLLPAKEPETAKTTNGLLYNIDEDDSDDYTLKDLGPEDPYITTKTIFDGLMKFLPSESLVEMTPNSQIANRMKYAIKVLKVPDVDTIEIRIYQYGYAKCVFYNNNIRITYYKSTDSVGKEPNSPITNKKACKIVHHIIRICNPGTDLEPSDIAD